jgi:hypothetical protein
LKALVAIEGQIDMKWSNVIELLQFFSAESKI